MKKDIHFQVMPYRPASSNRPHLLTESPLKSNHLEKASPLSPCGFGETSRYKPKQEQTQIEMYKFPKHKFQH